MLDRLDQSALATCLLVIVYCFQEPNLTHFTLDSAFLVLRMPELFLCLLTFVSDEILVKSALLAM